MVEAAAEQLNFHSSETTAPHSASDSYELQSSAFTSSPAVMRTIAVILASPRLQGFTLEAALELQQSKAKRGCPDDEHTYPEQAEKRNQEQELLHVASRSARWELPSESERLTLLWEVCCDKVWRKGWRTLMLLQDTPSSLLPGIGQLV